jgi:hypothetical protein
VTEAEWLACEDPMLMLDFLGNRPSLRKLRLFLCACCRRQWAHLREPARKSLEAGETFADGGITAEALEAARGPCYSGVRADNCASYAAVSNRVFRRKYRGGLFSAVWSAGWPDWVYGDKPECQVAERVAQAESLREVVGNPFRKVKLNKKWRTSTVVALAAQMYESRDFGAMPILADALQDAGCDSADTLTHCREVNATHVRGCWVVDSVLGKE